MKYIIILSIILNGVLYSYNSKDINNFYNSYYSSNYDINTIKNNSSQTYKNIYHLIESKKISDEKEKYNYLKNAINENADYEKSDDTDYLISVSELMNYIVYFTGLSEKNFLWFKKQRNISKNIKER